jgi:hypothetical protein
MSLFLKLVADATISSRLSCVIFMVCFRESNTVESSQYYRVSGLDPLSSAPKITQYSGYQICFWPEVKSWEALIQLGSLKRASPIHSFFTPVDGKRSDVRNIMFCLESWTVHKVQKPSNHTNFEQYLWVYRHFNSVVIRSNFLGWSETESTWYVGHSLAYCTSSR